MDGDGQRVLAVSQQLCNVKGKGRIAARVHPGEQAVEIHGGPLVDGAEVQKRPHTGLLQRRERAAVPEDLLWLQRPADAGQRRFRRKRHENLPVPAAGAGVGGRDGIVPQAVEIIVALPHELRTRIFLQYVRFVQRFAPACHHFAPSLFRSSSTGGRISSSTTAAARKMDGVGTVLTTPRSM